MFVKQFVGACGGASLLQGISKHACPAGVVCNRLRRGELFRKLGLYAYPAGASFCADKRMQKRFRAAP